MEQTILNFRRELQNLGYSKKAVDNYPKYAQNLLDYTKENPQKINDLHIKNYYEYLKTKTSQITKKNISQSHINSNLLAVKLYFDYLERTHKIKRNPYNLRSKQAEKKQRKIFTQQEIKLLYQKCETTIEKTILNLCYGCGLRRSEVEALELKDINFEQQLLFVRRGKGKKRRAIPLSPAINHNLKEYSYYTHPFRKQDTIHFLIDPNGIPLKGSTLYCIFKKLVKRIPSLDEKKYCLHSLRHSIATHLLENEISVEMVRNFLGHTQLATTQIYTQINLKESLVL